MWDGIERRRFARVQYPCLITVRRDKSPSFSILTHTENISVGGVRVIIGQRIELMTEVDLEIDLKDTLPNVTSEGTVTWVKEVPPGQKGQPTRKDTNIKTLKGTVTWVKEVPPAHKGQPSRYDTGIKFIVLQDEDKKRIQSIIDHFLGKKRY